MRYYNLLLLLSMGLRTAYVANADQDEIPEISQYLSSVKASFDDAGITETLGIEFSPVALLDVIWAPPEGVSRPIRFYPGGHLTDNYTIPLPAFKSIGPPDTQKGPFLIIAVDPDAPTPEAPIWKSIRHFIGANFYVDSDSSMLTNRTKAISEWIRPSPRPESREHR
ncbi:hypothetical protein CVT24_009256 [Panaeolus cyanescens]|uniref:Uncharacterized protein n=1 Tax=Panaeolus cyanescens TaxID=181874 RepID=A0A409Y895_9AGAR|nr:hypothetical protein CVT24_009256 [Panaeolus cyanescens]